jgi:hypothetical protein
MKPFDRCKYLSQALLRFGAFCLLLDLLAGCSTPIGVVRGTTQDIYHELTANVLSAGEPSSWSQQALQRANLVEKFKDEPEAALKEMRKRLATDETPDRLFALAELSFYHAEQSGQNEHYLAAAVYAYAFLFPEDKAPQPDPLDPRRRLAADLYNQGLVRGLGSPDGEEVVLQAGKLSLPFGELDLSVDQTSYLWGGFRFKRLIPVGDFEVRGFSNRYRQSGIGAPLAAELEPIGSGAAAEEQADSAAVKGAGDGGCADRDSAARRRRRQTQRPSSDLRRRPHFHSQDRRARCAARARAHRRARLHA